MAVIVRMGKAGNGVPVFVIAGTEKALERPFGAQRDNERHVWMYPAYYPTAKKVLADFEVIKHQVTVEYSPTVVEYIKHLDIVEKRYLANELPEGFQYITTPFAHQIQGLSHVFHFLRSALFYAPGLGKSKIAVDLLRLLHFQGQAEPAIVMGPLVTVKNWGKEIDRHSGRTLRWGAVLGTKTQKKAVIARAAAGEFDALLVTYDTARNFVDQLVETVPYKTVVCDESHLIKEYTSARTKAAHEIGQKAVRKVLMTGTPTLGSPLDLYGQFKFLGDCYMPESYFAYKQKFIDKPDPRSHVVIGYKNLHILNARTRFLSIRKTKEECLDLPPQTFVDVEYELSKHQAAIYNQLVNTLQLDLGLLLMQLGGLADDIVPPEMQAPNVGAMLNKLLQISSGFLIKNNMVAGLCDQVEPGGCVNLPRCVAANIRPYTRACVVAPEVIPNTVTRFDDNPKLDALVELLSNTLGDPANKVIVWAYYHDEMDLVEDRLRQEGYRYVRVDGTTGARIQGLADQFNEDPAIQVYLAQISTGVGITLNAAAYMVYFALTYSLGAYLQSLDRNYRIGQTKNVTVYRLLGKQTIEASIARLLDNKVDIDQVLTQKLSCVVCPKALKCIANDVSLFGPGCIYKKNMGRPVVKALCIGDEDEDE